MSEPITPPGRGRPRRSHAAIRQLWTARLTRFTLSSLTVARFCAAEGVSVPSYYFWKRKLASPPAAPAQPAGFVAVRLTLPASTAAIELALPNGAVLRFPAGTDPAVIAGVVRQLGSEPC